MSPDLAPVLDVEGVSRRFARRWALRRVTFTLAPSAIVVLAGDNGAGKSTLLRIAAGLVKPSEGAVWTFGVPVQSPSVRSRVGYLGHQTFVYPELSGRENLTFFTRFYGHPANAAETEAILARIGLTEAAHRQVGTYSRGMVQRLALGRLLVQRAALWLLDEPTTGLDRAGLALLVDILREHRARAGSVLTATHDLAAFDTIVDRTIRLSDGRLLEPGASDATGAPTPIGDVGQAAGA